MRRSRLPGAIVAAALAIALGAIAVWPIYQTPQLWVVALGALLVGGGLGVLIPVLGRRQPPPVLVLIVVGAFALTVLPLAMPARIESAVEGGSPLTVASALVSALGDALAAVVLGWKQLLTLTLPVGSYQTVLVPAYIVFLLAGFTVVALRSSRFAPLAAIALGAPVAFGTLFGSSEVSAELMLPGVGAVAAPRELSLWFAAALLGAAWVAGVSGAEHRQALSRLTPGRKGRAGLHGTRTVLAIVVIALAAGLALVVAPLVGSGDREVPRDRVDPVVVLREQPSPLAAYRAFKSDEALDAPLFRVEGSGDLPERLRLAVLDAYDGVDFHVGVGLTPAEASFGKTDSGSFTRFPSSGRVDSPVAVTVTIEEGYSDIWAPIAELGSVPVFAGPRADTLADSFYVNRTTESAIDVARDADGAGVGLQPGDSYRALMSSAPDVELSGRPAVEGAQLDLENLPELTEWVRVQGQAATGEGLVELIRRLTARGYLSHALTETEGSQLWLSRLQEQYGTQFWASAGGHSVARIEQLFGQLNAQERRAGPDENVDSDQLIAAVGDDEQFATAAALVARALGFDSRVVVGVRLQGAETVPGVPPCGGVCTGENLAAWVEVRGADGVWASIDTTPQPENRPSSLEEGEQLPEFPTTPEERNAQEVDPPIGVGDPNESSEEPGAPSQPGWLLPLLRAVGLALLALLFLALPWLFIPLAKRARSARRRREDHPEIRALGAWQELLDALVDSDRAVNDRLRSGPGGGVAGRGSRREIATMISLALPVDHPLSDTARVTAQAVDHAVFSAEGISSTEAEQLWLLVDRALAQYRASLSRWHRIFARYSLRSYGVRLAVPRSGAEESRHKEEEQDEKWAVDERRRHARVGGRM